MKSVTSRSVYKIMEMMSSSSSIWFMSSKEDSCLRKYFYTNCNSQQVEAFKISWYVTRDSESEISMQEGTRWCFRYKLSSTHQVFLLNFVWIVDCREDSSFMKKNEAQNSNCTLLELHLFMHIIFYYAHFHAVPVWESPQAPNGAGRYCVGLWSDFHV